MQFTLFLTRADNPLNELKIGKGFIYVLNLKCHQAELQKLECSFGKYLNLYTHIHAFIYTHTHACAHGGIFL